MDRVRDDPRAETAREEAEHAVLLDDLLDRLDVRDRDGRGLARRLEDADEVREAVGDERRDHARGRRAHELEKQVARRRRALFAI